MKRGMRKPLAVLVALAVAVFAAVPAQAAAPRSRRAAVSAQTQTLGFESGRISIPSIGIDEVIREGVDMDVIDRGVAHWAGTADAGGHGNMVLAGHRTTYSKPFHDLDRLQEGDVISVEGLDGQTATYRVSETLIVEPTDIWIVDWTDTPTLTMFACHPKGSARYRIVVRAELAIAPLVLP